MRKRLLVIIALAALFSPQLLLAEFVNSNIFKTGTFSNGVEYCLVNNSTEKGVVDIALVQRQSGDVRSLLDSLDGMGKRSPAAYLADRGVAYGRGGYAFREAGATVWRFTDVPVGATMDSTLFLLSNIVKSSPVASTLIMCGDINTSSIADRMGLLMLSVPKREPATVSADYEWQPQLQRKVKYIYNGKENTAVVLIKFSIPRLPAEARTTTQPILCRFFAACMTSTLRERMSIEFKRRNIGFSDLKAIYLDSATTSGDESYTISFRVLPDELGSAMTCAAAVMSGIDRFGVSQEEFIRVNSGVFNYLVSISKTGGLTNAGYVRNCLNACLNGASLTAIPDVLKYFEEHHIGAEKMTGFFNTFASALLDRSKNASFSFLSSYDPGVDRMMSCFDEGWNYPVTFSTPQLPAYNDVFHRTISSVSIRREITDNISGGTMWRFSNGMKVIFKRTSEGTGLMNYYLVIRGGVQKLADPGPGETAFVQDMFKLSGIGGMSHSDFDKVLATKRIDINSFANFNGLTLYGKIPTTDLKHLPCVLASLTKIEVPSSSDVEYYRKCIRTGDENPSTMLDYKIDRLLRPDDKQLEYKFSKNITDSTAIKAVNYYKDEFSRMNDGVLLLFGDMDPEAVWRILHRNLGVLPTKKRPVVTLWDERPQLSTGVNMVMDSSVVMEVNSARIKIKLAENISRSSNFTFTLATMCIKETVEKILLEHGFFVRSGINYSLYPEDTYTATYDILPCREFGLPGHVGKPSSVLDALADIHTELRTGQDIAVGKLDLYKTLLTSKMDVELSDEYKLIEYSLLRYTAGKNMTGDYKSLIKSVTEAQVRDMATKILNSGRVEYVVR